jgi:protein O-GlcNAc transferase
MNDAALSNTECSTSDPPRGVDAVFAEALKHHCAGLLAEAEGRYRRILASSPAHFDSLHMLGVVEYQRERYGAALELIDRALTIDPMAAPAHNNRGVVLAALKSLDEAIVSYDRAIALAPSYFDAFINRGNALKELKRYDDALAAYDRAIALGPASANAFNKRGIVLTELHRLDEAVANYDQALALDCNFSAAHGNRGVALAGLKRLSEAIESYDRAIALSPGAVDAYNNRGQALMAIKHYDAAVSDFDRAIAINPESTSSRGYRLHATMHACDWRAFGRDVTALAAQIEADRGATEPFHLVAAPVHSAALLKNARRYCRDQYPASPTQLAVGERYRHDRIRLAYVSADLQEHATAYLTAGMIEHHDRSKFEIIAVSFGPAEDSPTRHRLMRGFDRFLDVRAQSDQAVAQLIRGLEVDIAVDLKGFTADARTGIFAKRPAPIQVSYLGYPGTMGADYIDYVIADRVVLPENQRALFSEQAVYLPDSYQVNDATRRIAVSPSRAEMLLPERAFVFCCFNSCFKITPDVFDVWMRLLRTVEDSVLWLFAGNAVAPRNLRSEAQRRGVDPERLIFAPQLAHQRHLARHRHADLFLDTLHYNAHTSASDALWAGLPVLTCMGETFASRVAGSLLSAVGLPELITCSLTDYEALALALARDPARLAAVRDKLADNLTVAPLFDTARFTRHIEMAYTTMWERAERGEPPQSFAVSPIDRQATSCQ